MSTPGRSVSGLQVIVKQETPFLPKVAFVLISLASLAGVTFTSTQAGLTPLAIGCKWLSLWGLALVGGLAAWRTFYVRQTEPDTSQTEVDSLLSTANTRARTVGRWLVPVLALGVTGPLVAAPSETSFLLAVGAITLAALAAIGVDRAAVAPVICVIAFGEIIVWAISDAGTQLPGLVRILHLTAFTLWLGGALWNIAVAMPTGRMHPNIDAVVAGANQLDRFRWVVRFALPTIIVTGLIMAEVYRVFPLDWWTSFPGVLIPLKVLTIIALVVVFITCPLFRHCSPVQGVCNLDDLEQNNLASDDPVSHMASGGLAPGHLAHDHKKSKVAR